MVDAAVPLLVYPYYHMLYMLQRLSALHRSNQYYTNYQKRPDDASITITIVVSITPILQYQTETSCMPSFRHVCRVFMNSNQKLCYVCLSIHPYGTWLPLHSFYNVSYLGFLLKFADTF
jgi:hypothetical protein